MQQDIKKATRKTNHRCKRLDCFTTLYAMVNMHVLHSRHGDVCVCAILLW